MYFVMTNLGFGLGLTDYRLWILMEFAVQKKFESIRHMA